MASGVGTDYIQKARDIDRLGDVIAAADHVGPFPFLDLGRGGQSHYGVLIALQLQRGGRGEAILHRHLQIHQHDIGSAARS
jgi:hypothetical protein